MRIHLTIDLDYYDMGCDTEDKKKSFLSLIDKVHTSKLEVTHIMMHHEVVELISRKRYDKIINVDFHSDIVYDDMIDWKDPDEFNEGTWANFYPFKKGCIFEWRYPSTEECFRKRWGRCEWTSSTKDPFQKSRMGYKDVIRRQGLKGISLDAVRDVSICYSPEWCKNKETYFDVREIIGDNPIMREAIEIDD